jgi:hypothetical protein
LRDQEAIRTLSRVGTSGIRNVRINSGNLQYEIFAGGGGTKGGGFFGVPEFCAGATGGSQGVEVTAHYKQVQTAKLVKKTK